MTIVAERDLPTFFLLGAPKAGTTALWAMLRQHPEVYLPDHKEPHFFAYRDHDLAFGGPADARIMRHMVIRDEEAYRALFRGRPEAARGDASVMQLYVPGTEARIRAAVPDARLLVVLRDPVQRAFSSWLHLVRDDRETLPFEAALLAENERVEADWIPLWHYQQVGTYAAQLERWWRHFPQDQLHVVWYEDLRADPHGVLRRVLAFLDVDPAAEIDVDVRRNVSGLPRNRWLQRLLSRPHLAKEAVKRLVPGTLRERLVAALRNLNVADKPTLDPSTEASLRAHFVPEVERLETFTGRDLSAWKP